MFVEQGARWKCNMCSLTNEGEFFLLDCSSCFTVPTFFDWDPHTNQRVDRRLRPEISYGIVEYIAPQEYMVILLVKLKFMTIGSCSATSHFPLRNRRVL